MFRTTSSLPIAAAAIVAVTVIAACGSSSPSAGVSTSTSSTVRLTDAQAQRAVVAFSRCMRAHGLAGFPDPSSPRQFKESFSPGVAQAPAFQSADAACKHLLPNGGPRSQPAAPPSHAQLAALLAFARCMRSHGFPSFPDPTADGQLTHEMLASAGISLHQPAVVPAADACVGVTHGVITKAMVARFVAGQ